jgi:hypothetical protein
MKNFRQIIFKTAIMGLALGSFTSLEAAEKPTFYARAEKSTPVLNTDDFRSVFGGADGRTLKRDASGLVREVEFIAFPGTVFEIEGSVKRSGVLIYKVRTAEYPSPPSGLYIDSRFVKVFSSPPRPRVKKLPPKKVILERMLKNQGAAYVWGANDPKGVPDLLRCYVPRGKISSWERDLWTLKGLDCSGLLYEATEGSTPRNTSDLVLFGKPVPIEGRTVQEIARQLEPLDLIVWKGHVIIVLDKARTIESCLSCSAQGGVTVRQLEAVLKEVMSARVAADRYRSDIKNPFVVRRWHYSDV